MKKILIIKAHSRDNSFCNALSDEYAKGLKDNNQEFKTLFLNKVDLESYLKYEHTEIPELSEDFIKIQNLIIWADHLVFAYPTWWASPPALLKIFFEIVFHSGFAFKYKKSNGFAPKWDKLLLNKTARLIVTMDSPVWYYRFFVGDPGFKMMKNIMNFCGINKVKKSYFGSIKISSEKKKKRWLEKAYKIGLSD